MGRLGKQIKVVCDTVIVVKRHESKTSSAMSESTFKIRQQASKLILEDYTLSCTYDTSYAATLLVDCGFSWLGISNVNLLYIVKYINK